ncbi:hypothetical protein C1J02_01675 [Sulfitobacter sp. SK011]|nr:hypothetical protein C1J02_01675 [Sulfitobacter sp. SK011]
MPVGPACSEFLLFQKRTFANSAAIDGTEPFVPNAAQCTKVSYAGDGNCGQIRYKAFFAEQPASVVFFGE